MNVIGYQPLGIDMSEINNLFELCEHIGFAAVDAEIEPWIEMGEFDEAVKKRAEALGWIAPDTPYSELDRPLW
jgi:hypothetical protein